jgi:alkylation response protein AidB-like acyl-CoA dehydrogenase
MAAFVERKMDTLYHDLILPEETQEIRKKVREFADRVVAPRAYEISTLEEAVENFPRDVFDAMAKEGLFQIPYPKEVGGMGLKYPTCATAVAVEELAYHSNSIAAIFDVQCILSGMALAQGSDDIKKRYLMPMIKGDIIGSFATTEPDASSDLSIRAMKSEGVKKGNKYIVNGQKRFITNGPVADYVCILIKVEDQMTKLVIDLDSPGVRVGNPDKKMGNRGQLTCDLHFKDVEVPVENRIGEEGKGLHISLGTLTYGRIGIAASGAGMAQAAFDKGADYLVKRKAFGQSLVKFQHWQFRWAERAIQIENSRNLYSKAAMLRDRGVEFPEPEAAGAKYYATECAGDLARDVVQVFGGYGFLRELGDDGSRCEVEQIFRDFKIAEIYEGTNEIQKMVLARTIFGRELTK